MQLMGMTDVRCEHCGSEVEHAPGYVEGWIQCKQCRRKAHMPAVRADGPVEPLVRPCVSCGMEFPDSSGLPLSIGRQCPSCFDLSLERFKERETKGVKWEKGAGVVGIALALSPVVALAWAIIKNVIS